MDLKKILHHLGFSIYSLLIPIFFFLMTPVLASSYTVSRMISWNTVKLIHEPGFPAVYFLSFDGYIQRDGFDNLPFYVLNFPSENSSDDILSMELIDLVVLPIPDSVSSMMPDRDKLTSEFLLFPDLATYRKISSLMVSILPIRKNPESGIFERLISFTLKIESREGTTVKQLKSVNSHAANSVLAAGTWFKYAVSNSGIQKLSYNDLKKANIDPSGIDPRNIRIYGNGGGMLAESNQAKRIDDLIENSIYVAGEADGKFDPEDYILFYGESPDTWYYSKQDNRFHHKKNVYSDLTYYFLNFDLGRGKRLGSESSTTMPATHIITKFNDYAFYEKDDVNLIKSGREWYDRENFDVTTIRNYTFSFPDLDTASFVNLTAVVAARSTNGSTSFTATVKGKNLINILIPATGNQYTDEYAIERSASSTFISTSPVIDIRLTYNKPNASASGYLNYFEMNVRRLLKMSGSQMAFRSVLGSGSGKISEFTLTGQGQTLAIWDVSRRDSIRLILTTKDGNKEVFRLPTDTIREFIAFDGSSFYSPEFSGSVPNQNLHGQPVVDYIIVSPPVFIKEAEKLAEFHRQHSCLSVLTVTPEQIYHEFSSGAQDVAAIRDFVKMMYDRAIPGKEPKYLLFFGDASYDYKNRIQNNTNLIPAYQSENSLDPINSYVTDDFFGLMDDGEGQGSVGEIDIGIGRFPVNTVEEAQSALAKVFHYCANSDSVKNDWRNVVCFVADDQDEGGNLFINDSEDLVKIIESNHKAYNNDKIYLDSYTQVSTPGGARYPEVNEAINKRVEKGALIINYIGHGGEVGWSHERVLEVPDIKGWRNFDRMPVFMTATCEFSRFDDPERVSAGEYVFLNSYGGGIALFTTTRLTFAGSNKTLSVNFYNNVFKKTGGIPHKMGDLIVLSKKNMGTNMNARKFALIGDPALKMAYPELSVVTTSIVDNHQTSVAPDTLRALSEITITGEIQDESGQKVNHFDGTVFPTVFDKASEIFTKGNDGLSPVKFYLRKNPVYKGKVEVINGDFSFTFIVPKDIAYQYGLGKISYYARNEETDAQGFDEDIMVGGYNNEAIIDDQGPLIRLYLNDRNFVSGGITNQNPIMLADVSDESGINTVGNGIGHDITAVLDDKTSYPFILNEYYVSDLNTYKSGVIAYPLSKLTEGSHHITLKVWDVYNNSSEAGIDFHVISSSEFAFQRLINYPNPMRDQTTFSFETNQINQVLGVEIRIYNLYGALLKTIQKSLYSDGYRVEPVTWDGTTDQGWKISSGTYIYHVLMTIPNGTTSHLSSKLVVIR